MAHDLVDELLLLQAANNTLLAISEEASRIRNNPPWIIADINPHAQSESLDNAHGQPKGAVEREALLRFYKEGLTSRTHEDDKSCVETSDTRNLLVEELERRKVKRDEAQKELVELNAQVETTKSKIASDTQTVRALESQIDDLKHTLDQERKAEQKRIIEDKTQAEIDKAAAASKARADAEKEIANLKGSIRRGKASTIGGVIKWFFIGALIATFAVGFGQPIITAIVGDVNTGLFLTIILGGVITFIPVVKYLKDARLDISIDRSLIKYEKESSQQKIEEFEEATSEKEQKKQQDAIKRFSKREEEIAVLQDELTQITANERNEQAALKRLEADQPQCEAKFNDAQKAVEVLAEELNDAEKKADQAFNDFLFSLEDEFLTLQEQERKRFEKTVAHMELLHVLSQITFTRALSVRNAGVTYDPSDLVFLPRVIEKLQSNRASTLSEALNAVDADLRAERQHAEQMAANRRHHEQIEEEKRRQTHVLEQKAQAELELQERRAREEARRARKADADLRRHYKRMEEAEFEQARVLEEQAAAELEILAQQAAEEAERAEKMQAEQLEFLEKQAAVEAKKEEQRQQESIQANIRHCQSCPFAPSGRIDEFTYCNEGGWFCKESDRCNKF